jgi:putative nucleotidyltransferase with HDIG domain
MEEVQMPPHIRRHSFTVAEVACYLASRLNENSVRMDLSLVESGALLHDIAKGRCIRTGENHAEVGAMMAREWGYLQIAPIIESHVHIDETFIREPVTEAVVVNYADKRVRHVEVVTLEDRFLDLMERYGKTPTHIAGMQKKLELFLRLEEMIFAHLSIQPDDLLELTSEIRSPRR